MNTTRIENLTAKLIVGKTLRMSLAQNRTTMLWQSFMPERNNIPYQVGTDLYSIQIYDTAYFQNFNPANELMPPNITAINVDNMIKCPVPQFNGP